MAKRGPGRPRKPTGSITDWAKWKRAQRAHGNASGGKKKKCSRCGSTNQVHIHHRNENKGDNRPVNRMLLCIRCHNKQEPKRRKG